MSSVRGAPSKLSAQPHNHVKARYTRNNFFKAIGLELFPLLFQKSKTELPKPVYTSSLKTAIFRSAVHWIPVGGSIVIITINLCHLFLGREYPGAISSQPINAFLLQIAAKTLEMLIVASLTVIVLHIIRRELIQGPGVPLGAIGGAFLFSSVSYLWSTSLWGAFKSATPNSSKVRLYSIICLCALLAAAVGPSAAVLLAPREQDWYAGGATIWQNGGFEDIYPLKLPRSGTPQLSLCLQSNATAYPFCPSGGYAAILQEVMKSTFAISNVNQDARFRRILENHTPVDIRLANSINVADYVDINSLIMKWSYRGVDCQTGAVTGRMIEAIRARLLALDFLNAAYYAPFNPGQPSVSQYKYRKTIISDCAAQIPMVKAACSAAINATAQDSMIPFPVLKQDDCWIEEQNLNVSNLTSEPSSQIRTYWIQLPRSFGPTSTGMILETPWDENTQSRLLIGCSIGAAWSNGTVTNPEDAWMYRGVPTYGSPWIRGYVGEPYVSDPSWQTIEFGSQWLNMVSPPLDLQTNVTTLDFMLESSGILDGLFLGGSTQEDVWNQAEDSFNRSVSVESILAVVFADALSRESSLDGLKVNTSQRWHDWDIQNVDRADNFGSRIFTNKVPYQKPETSPIFAQPATVTVVGLAYQASAPSDYIAIVVLCIYICAALAHVVFLVYSRESSGSWHTLTELIALAHNSPPSQMALRNTGAGIKELGTFGQVAVIRATESCAGMINSDGGQSSSVEKLSLVFKQGDNDDMEKEGLLENAAGIALDDRKVSHAQENRLEGCRKVRFDVSYI